LITVMPEFGLSLYQQPSGADMRVGLRGEPARVGATPLVEPFPTKHSG
ncbi:mechanosensitive ion channel family protein, partial [Pseudomonas syringae]|nr:mechanosensitive ion channel family protein [Pseudomonas syringae]